MSTNYRQKRRETTPFSARALALDLVVTNLATLAAVVFLSSSIKNPSAVDWLIFPAGFLYSNLIEYLLHRYVMHRSRKWLSFAFERHAIQHHSFYTDENPSYDRFSDCRLVFFPAPMQLSFIAAVVAVGFFFIRPFAGANLSNIFVLSLLLYFLNYELFHYIYHTRESSWLLKIPGMRRLRELHTAHHDKSNMKHLSFNITYPIFDLVFGTLATTRSTHAKTR